MADPVAAIRCLRCGGAFTPVGLLARAVSFWPDLRVLRASTPCCGAGEEVRIREGVLERGYVYAAGSPHFSAEQSHALDGVDFEAGEKGLTIRWRGGDVFVPNAGKERGEE